MRGRALAERAPSVRPASRVTRARRAAGIEEGAQVRLFRRNCRDRGLGPAAPRLPAENLAGETGPYRPRARPRGPPEEQWCELEVADVRATCGVDQGADQHLEQLVHGRFLNAEQRQEFFAAYGEIEILWEILSPAAALRDHIDTFKRLANLYAAVRNVYADRAGFVADLAYQTRRLVPGSTAQRGLGRLTSSLMFDGDTLEALRGEPGSDEAKVFDLVRGLCKEIEDDPDAAPGLQPLKDRAERGACSSTAKRRCDPNRMDSTLMGQVSFQWVGVHWRPPDPRRRLSATRRPSRHRHCAPARLPQARALRVAIALPSALPALWHVSGQNGWPPPHCGCLGGGLAAPARQRPCSRHGSGCKRSTGAAAAQTGRSCSENPARRQLALAGSSRTVRIRSVFAMLALASASVGRWARKANNLKPNTRRSHSVGILHHWRK